MKTRYHPMINNNPFINKENINPLLNINSKNILIKKNAKDNFFDEMDQLLNVDFWKKNSNKTNCPSNVNSSIKQNNLNKTLNKIDIIDNNNIQNIQ